MRTVYANAASLLERFPATLDNVVEETLFVLVVDIAVAVAGPVRKLAYGTERPGLHDRRNDASGFTSIARCRMISLMALLTHSPRALQLSTASDCQYQTARRLRKPALRPGDRSWMGCVHQVRPAPTAQAKIKRLMELGLQADREIEERLGHYSATLGQDLVPDPLQQRQPTSLEFTRHCRSNRTMKDKRSPGNMPGSRHYREIRSPPRLWGRLPSV